ncbi:MAG: PH domain-containing protein [Patescibacteria group bacterium]|nr:PH domain-containing protein [Patescibacteria group bacterium]
MSQDPKEEGALASFVEQPENVHFETQEDNEKVLYLLRRHWFTNTGWLSLGFLLLVLPLVFFISDPFLSSALHFNFPLKYQLVGVLVWYLITFGFLLENFLMWYFDVYIITNERLVDVDFYGLFYKQISECALSRIQDVTHRMGGVAQIMFNYGNVIVQTAGTHDYFEFELVPEPDLVQKKIFELVEEHDDRVPVSGVLLDRRV